MTSPIQLLLKDDNGKFTLNEAALRAVVEKDDVRDLHVVAVSIVGAFRKGKSFLSNFLLRYLNNMKEEDWFGDDNSEIIRNFEWRAGEKRTTTGILLWPEVFQIEESNLGVILLDTQGMFDAQADSKENMQIFSLSTLISSIQIYNISQEIQLDHLHHLQYFVEYGRLALDEVHFSKPFQRLVFLIRDWYHRKDKDFGLVGGSQYLQQWIYNSKNEEIMQIRDLLKKCYNDVSCYLMPPPGEIVADGDSFTGKFSEMSETFRYHMKLFVENILIQFNLQKKKIGGQAIKFKDYTSYIKMYIQNIQSEKLPNPTSLLEAAASVHMKVAVDESKDKYMVLMNEKFKSGMIVENVELLHDEQLQVCLQHFDSIKKLQCVDVRKYKEELIQDIKTEYAKFCSLNGERKEAEKKNVETKMTADTADQWFHNYQTAISGICEGEPKQEEELLMYHSNQKSECLDSFLANVKDFHYQMVIQEYSEKLKKDIEEWYVKIVVTENHKKLKIADEQMICNVLDKCKDIYSTHMINSCGGRGHVKAFDEVHFSALQKSEQYFHENTKRSLSSPETLANQVQTLRENIKQTSLEFKKQNERKEIAESEEKQHELLKDAEIRAREIYQKMLMIASENPMSETEFDQLEENIQKESLSIFHVIAKQCNSNIVLELEELLKKDCNDLMQEYKIKNKIRFDKEREQLQKLTLQKGKIEALKIYTDIMDKSCSSENVIKDLQSIHNKARERAREEFITHAKDVENWESYWQSLINDDISRSYEKYNNVNNAKEITRQSDSSTQTRELKSSMQKYRSTMRSECRDSREKISDIHDRVLENVVEDFMMNLDKQNIQYNNIIDELKNKIDDIYQNILTTLSDEDEKTCEVFSRRVLQKYKQSMDKIFDVNSLTDHIPIEKIHKEALAEAMAMLETEDVNIRTEYVLKRCKSNLIQDMEDLLKNYKEDINERRKREDDERKRKEQENCSKILKDATSNAISNYKTMMENLCSEQNAVYNLESFHVKYLKQVTEEFNSKAKEVGGTEIHSYHILEKIQKYYDLKLKQNNEKIKQARTKATSNLNRILNAAKNRYHTDLENLAAKTVTQFRSAERLSRENAFAAFNDFIIQDEDERYTDLVDKYKLDLDEQIQRSRSFHFCVLSEHILQVESERAKQAYISEFKQYIKFDSPSDLYSSHMQCKSDAISQLTQSTIQCDAESIRIALQELDRRIEGHFRIFEERLKEKRRNKNGPIDKETLKMLFTTVALGVGYMYGAGAPLAAVAGVAYAANSVLGRQATENSGVPEPNLPSIKFDDTN